MAVLEILCVEPIHPQYSGVLETCLALRYWYFEVLDSESFKGNTKTVDTEKCVIFATRQPSVASKLATVGF